MKKSISSRLEHEPLLPNATVPSHQSNLGRSVQEPPANQLQRRVSEPPSSTVILPPPRLTTQNSTDDPYSSLTKSASAGVVSPFDGARRMSYSSSSLDSGAGGDLLVADRSNALSSEEREIQLRRRKTPSSNVRITFLAVDYTPTVHDVLCGRGYKTWTGNQAYRATVYSKLEEYSAAHTKLEKTAILCQIVNKVREKSIDGGFIKKCPETRRWYEVGDFLAREKTSQYFRDALHEQYRSSGQSKYKRRKVEHAMALLDETEATKVPLQPVLPGGAPTTTSRRRSLQRSLQQQTPPSAPPPPPSASQVDVVTALQEVAAPVTSPEVAVCALQLEMRRPNETILESLQRGLEGMTRVACQQKIDLFVLPELSPVGYSEDTFARFLPKTPALQEVYRKIDDAFANQARILRTFICYGTVGWIFRPNGSLGFSIRQNVLDRTGRLVASYDKIHFCDYGDCAETHFFEAGPRAAPVSFSIDGFRFGLLICADMRNPTLSRSLVRDHKVDVLLQPAAFARDVSFRTWKSFRETRAVENSVYFIGVNYAGEAFGETSVVPPWVDELHEPLVMGRPEGYLVGRIQRSTLNMVRTTMPFYRQICAEGETKSSFTGTSR